MRAAPPPPPASGSSLIAALADMEILSARPLSSYCFDGSRAHTVLRIDLGAFVDPPIGARSFGEMAAEELTRALFMLFVESSTGWM